jgi:4-amino-4-deoxy-L-arabinose transferase-like glycosyltransferase
MGKIKMLRLNKKLTIIILILIIALSLRLFPIRIAHFWDETVYLQHAEMMFSGRHNFDELAFRPPFLSILFFLGFFIFHSPISASIICALIGTAGAFVIYLIGKKVYNEKAGMIAGLIFAFTPFIILNSNYLLTDIPAIVFGAIALYLALFKDKKIYLFLAGIIFSISILTKFTAGLMILVLIYLFVIKKYSLKMIGVFILGMIICILPYIIWTQITYGSFISPIIIGQGMVGDNNESTLFYFQNLPHAFGYIIIVGLILWFIGLIFSILKKDYSKLKTDSVFILWTVLFLLYLTLTPHKELRYVLPVAVPIILFTSSGLTFLLDKLKKYYRAVFWIVLVFYLIYMGSLSYGGEAIRNGQFVDFTVTDEMKVAHYLVNELNYTGIIYSNERWPVLAYYSGLETRTLFPNDPNFYEKYETMMNNSGILIGMYNVKDPQPFWLNKNSQFVHLKDIGEFFIYKYELHNP